MTPEERAEFIELLKDAHSTLGELDDWLGRAAHEANMAGVTVLKVEAATVRQLARDLAGRITIQLGTQKSLVDGRLVMRPPRVKGD